MPDSETIFQDGDISQSALLPTGHLSASQIKMYLRCQMQFYWRYIMDIVRPPKAVMVEGSALHKALEHALGEKMLGNQVLPSFMKDAWRQRWTQQEVEIEDWEGESKSTAYQQIEDRGMKFIEMYHDHFLPQIQPQAVEKDFQLIVGQSRTPIIGFIDLVDGAGLGTVVDHKVVSISKSETEVQGDLQLTLYSMATGMNNVRFDCFVKTKSPKILKLASTRTLDDYRWTSLLVDRVVQGIHSGNFIPCAPGSYTCSKKQCGYFDLCRR